MTSRVLLVGLFLAGCGRTVTEEDCFLINQNMREAWALESKKAAADGPALEKAALVIKAEGDALAADWMAECHKELKGRRVEPAEMDCLRRAKSLHEINQCSAH